MSEWSPLSFDETKDITDVLVERFTSGKSLTDGAMEEARHEQKVQKDLNIFKKPLEYSAHFEGKITDPNFLADLFSQEEARKRGEKQLERIGMSRLESCADFARILLDDFESAERVCGSKSSTNLAKHELIIRRLNTYIEMDRHMVTEVISDMRAKYAHKMNESLDHIDGKMEMLGISLNLADPDGTISRKGYSSDTQKQVWEAVHDDYRKLSDAIKALRKGLHE